MCIFHRPRFYGRSQANFCLASFICLAFLPLLACFISACDRKPTSAQDQSSPLWEFAVDPAGGIYKSDSIPGLIIEAPASAVPNIVNIEVDTLAQHMPMPQGFFLRSRIYELMPDGQLFNTPVYITLPYDSADISSHYNLGIYSYLDSSWEELSLVEIDSIGQFVTAATFHFTTLAVLEAGNNIPVSPNKFSVLKNGFKISNSSPGYCLGMVSFSKWLFEHTDIELYARYDNCTAQEVARIAQDNVPHNATQQQKYLLEFSSITEPRRGERLIRDVNRGKTQILGISDGTLFHAVLVYDYDAVNGFHIYDPNFPGQERFISFNGTNMGDYPLDAQSQASLYHILTNDIFQLSSVSAGLTNIFKNVSKTTPFDISGIFSGTYTVNSPSRCSGESGTWTAQLTEQCNSITGTLDVSLFFSTTISGSWDGTNLSWSGSGGNGIAFNGVFDGTTFEGTWTNGPECYNNDVSIGLTSGTFTGSR